MAVGKACFLSLLFLCFDLMRCEPITPIPCPGQDPSGALVSVNVTPCSRAPTGPCEVARGNTARMYINFTAPYEIEVPYTYVYGVVAGINVAYDIGSYAAVCDNLKSGESCPLQENKNYGYSAAVAVSKAYPPILVPVKFEIHVKKDSSSDQIVCFMFPLKIK